MVAANLTSNKLPEHGASLTVDVSGCTCQVMNDCRKITPLLVTSNESTHSPFSYFPIVNLVD